jgi:serine/threonine protein kinase
MGVVYEAVDEERGARVALKTLSALAPGALFRFKQEYRSLADLTHVNFVTLYELMATGDTWFFTMELVDGVNLLHHVWGAAEPPAGPGLPAVVEARLRAALRQLATGVEALHAASLLHLDLKPTNVLVEPSGRVVILDFGLVQSLDGHAELHPEGNLAGTPLYVSPEQVLGSRAGPASDWYALGVILFEALTGAPPFQGNAISVMMARTIGPAPDPAARRDGLPADLTALCTALLVQDPAGRARGRDVLACCDDARPAPRSGALHRVAAPLVGRDRELAALHRLCDGGAPGEPVCMFVAGASGVGKTALVGELATRLEAAGALVLRGRCYERESMPFKGFDAVIDALCRKLDALPAAAQRALLDEDLHHTARIFSVLRDLDALTAIRLPAADLLDPQALRLRAFAGLKRLLRRLAADRRIVIVVDDLHWADADSAHLLRELLAPPDPAPVLVIGMYRDDEARDSPFLHEILGAPGSPAARFRDHTVTLAPLAPEAAEQLARACLGPACDADRVRAVAREAGGVPFFIEAVARYGAAAAGDPPGDELPSLDRLIDQRLHDLPASARRLLHVVAIAARPIEQELALAAAELTGAEQAVVAQLRSARLVRTRGGRGADLVEPYHDRIRQVIAASLAPTAQAEVHRRLADALEAGPRAPAEALAFHLHGAGQLRRAAEHAERAARQAVAALAFERAAELFANALRWGDATPERTREIQIERAQALFNAGRCGDAARVYLEAADGAAAGQRRELRRLAAESFLYGGHVDEGLQVARALLAEVGLAYPRSQRRAMIGIVVQLGALRVRGIEPRRRPAGAMSADAVFQLDLCWSLGKGLGNVLPLEGTYFMVLALARALQLGEPRRVGRSLAFVGGAVLSQSSIGKRYLERAEQIGRELGDGYLAGLPLIMRGLTHLVHTARWQPAIELVDRGIDVLRSNATGVSWEHTLGTGIVLKALEAIGDLAEIGRRAVVWRRESEERGDKYAQVMAGQFEMLAMIGRGEIDAAREQDRRLFAMWSIQGYTAQHFHSLILRVHCELYQDRRDAAWRVFHDELPKLEGAYYERIPIARVPIYYLRACLQIGRAWTQPGERDALLRAAARLGQRLSKEQRVDGPVHAMLIAAAIAAARGDRGRARALLEGCRHAYRCIDMPLLAACVERRLAELSEDRDLLAHADAECRRLGVVDPACWADAYVPRFS